ncbi:hypothetical protein KGF56_002137 [Candida oxycetoniae]|uniref:Transcription factor domain-containing protein n=1 Tax=Candida oxycetoniae TaxID=497107 RepID=A0AAI9SYE6_9ASCO|nr:uncharacterized protein KGF56_002137 [Candida oxycetoniae]KAI3405052.2 hypothetical protein KGF56_002137 [Candida oxycetoniae]
MKLKWGGRPYKDENKRRKADQVYGTTGSRTIAKGCKRENTKVINDDEIDTESSLPSLLLSPATASSFHTFVTSSYSSVLPSASDDETGTKELKQSTDAVHAASYFYGLESLQGAIDQMSNGETRQICLQDSKILREFMLKIDENDNASTLSPTDTSAPSSYSQDLEKIEEYLSLQVPNFTMESMPLVYTPRHRAYENDFCPILQQQQQQQQPNGSSYEMFFNSIPPSLEALPSLLLEVPFYKSLLHFWVNVASQHCVPVPSHIYRENPFKVLLPQMAMEYPSILTTLLAFSAKMRSQLIGSDDVPDVIIDTLLSRSCTELLKLLQDESKAASDEALTTALLLSCFETLNSKDLNKHRVHTIGARQMIKAREANLLPKKSDKDVTFFLLRWFVYMDVIGALSASSNSDQYLLISGDAGSYEPVNSLTTLNVANQVVMNRSSHNIDLLMGFDLKLLSYFVKITLVARKTTAYLKQPGAAPKTIPQEIICEALEIEKALQNGCSADIEFIEPGNSLKRKEAEILKCTNKIFCDCVTIHLYRRGLRVPRNSSLVQTLARNVGLLAKKNIPAKSTTETCCVFCFFTAGCETLDITMQQFFEERFKGLSDLGNISARKALRVMRQCWTTGDDWIDAAEKLNLDLALF